jgi:hypothetical protein
MVQAKDSGSFGVWFRILNRHSLARNPCYCPLLNVSPPALKETDETFLTAGNVVGDGVVC